jgi:CRISPR/Cas system CSM-associated protein Csm3 (group 7 of RAMP superfamily)
MIENIAIIKAKVISISPLYIGDINQEPLIYEDEMAYLPATSIAGAFRAYLKSINKDYKKLFGDGQEGKSSNRSSIIVKDSFAKSIDYDRRNRVTIDGKYGSRQDGKKFERTYLKDGLEFEIGFNIQGLEKEIDELKNMIYLCLRALDEGIIRFGGSKSSGLGVFEVQQVEEVEYDLKTIDGLSKYLNNDEKGKVDITNKIKNMEIDNHYVVFKVEGKLTTPLIIKGTDVLDSNDADARSIRYRLSEGEAQYIIPGSSFKGVLRSRVEKIGNYFGTLDFARSIFGELSNEDLESDNKDSILSRVYVMESKIEGDVEAKYYMTKIDRFTGGVMYSALMNDIPVKGKTHFNVIYRKTNNDLIDNYSIGIIALALRDLSTENLALGGKSGIGRGRFKADNMEIRDGDTVIKIDFNARTIFNEDRLNSYIKAVGCFKGKEGRDE